ncbi:MAG: glycosyltransferase [Acidimicrobiales bacterium]
MADDTRAALRAEPVTSAAALAMTYVLPLRSGSDDLDDLPAYLGLISGVVEQIVVVDGSGPGPRRAHEAALRGIAEVCAPQNITRMGKVGGVLTGLEAARHEHVVIADDDVRYEPDQLVCLDALLAQAEVVRPQNYFSPLPWHSRFESARIVLNRVAGGDWPGTLAVRRSVILSAGGYAGDALFENLELVRTVRAAGGRELLALDLLVRRLPPTAAHFLSQQVREAYDEFARPVRLVASLALLPGVALAARRGARPVATVAACAVALAELGRRRCGGAERFDMTASLLAPMWLIWRSLCTWMALGSWLRGGVRYDGERLPRAATSMRELRRRHVQRAGSRADSLKQVETVHGHRPKC